MSSPTDDDSVPGYVPAPPPDSKVSVMEWLFAVGHAVARKLKPVPPSPMLRIHARR